MFKVKTGIEAEFLSFISEAIQEKYGISSEKADVLVNNSKVSNMIYTSPDYVMHYDVEDWADDIVSNSFSERST